MRGWAEVRLAWRAWVGWGKMVKGKWRQMYLKTIKKKQPEKNKQIQQI